MATAQDCAMPDAARPTRKRSGPVIDLSEIDTGAVAIDKAAIAEILPHRGHMAQLDAVVWTDPGYHQGVGVKYVRDDEFWCEGHIPGRPILPGVLMIEAGAQLASLLYYKQLPQEDAFVGFTRIENTAFRGLVTPGATLYLLCQEVKFSPRRFIADVQGVVGDAIVFETRVTGMRI